MACSLSPLAHHRRPRANKQSCDYFTSGRRPTRRRRRREKTLRRLLRDARDPPRWVKGVWVCGEEEEKSLGCGAYKTSGRMRTIYWQKKAVDCDCNSYYCCACTCSRSPREVCMPFASWTCLLYPRVNGYIATVVRRIALTTALFSSSKMHFLSHCTSSL